MYNIFLVGDILKSNIDNSFERILWIEGDSGVGYTIRLFTNKLIITKRKVDDLFRDKFEGNISILCEDPVLNLVPEKFTIEKHNSMMDRAYEIVKFIAGTENEPACYYGKNRRKLVIQASQKFNISEKVIYKYLRLYWQGGKIKSVLYPKYSNCGGPGKERNSFSKKPGRPDSSYYLTGENKGILIDDNTKKIFDIALDRYYYSTEKISLSETFRRMKSDFYTEKEYIEDKVVKKTMQSEKKPTFRQFQYHYYKRRDTEKEIIDREGEKAFNLNYRALASNSTQEAFGSGFRYQVDATVADIYLVSRIDRSSVIGRPVVYLAVDVFSRLITGLHVCLEGPNWSGISTLIYNCMEDKVSYCKQFGIDISNDIWPVAGLPEVFLGDRGELISPMGEKAIANLGISFENAPSGRGDAKGIVEKHFHIVNTKIRYWAPGAVKKEFRELRRKQLDDACLDIYQFTQMMIYTILQRNRKIIEGYPVTQKMIDDKVITRPIDLWNWGLKNQSGALRRLPDELLRINLMRTGVATVTESGIKFNKALYISQTEDFNKWYIEARRNGGWNVEISYDDRDMTSIYLFDKKSKRFHNLKLKDSSVIYLNRTFEEIEDYHFMHNVQIAEFTDDQDQNDVDYFENIDQIRKDAEKNKEKKGSGGIKNIRNNRREENKTYSKTQALSSKQGKANESVKEEHLRSQSCTENPSVEMTALKKLRAIKRCN